jgi:PPOX class probable F420-dependent enzyme
MALDSDLEKFANGKNYAALTTLMPDGQPQTQLVWIDTDGDHLLVNTEVGRRKYRNIEADPRVTVMIINGDNPYQYIEARGRVTGTITGDGARRQIDDVSRKYTGTDYQNPIGTPRVVLQITPERVHKNL